MISWIVYVDSLSFPNRIVKHNIFDHSDFFKDCQKNYKKNRSDKDAFLDRLRKDLYFWYGSKIEWEIEVAPLNWKHESDGTKIDVNQQVRLNWEPFCDYVWANKEEFKVED